MKPHSSSAQSVYSKTCRISVRKIVSQCIKSVRFYQCLKQQKNKISHLYTAVTPGFIPAPLHCAACSMNASIGYTVIPGVSSVQLLSAAIHEPWQNWNLVSAHGCACDPVAACSMGKPTFFLTGGEVTPAVICAKLTEAGLGDVQAVVGENLGTPQQKISKNAVRKISESVFAPLCVLLVESCEVPAQRVPGLPDEGLHPRQNTHDKAGGSRRGTRKACR